MQGCVCKHIINVWICLFLSEVTNLVCSSYFRKRLFSNRCCCQHHTAVNEAGRKQQLLCSNLLLLLPPLIKKLLVKLNCWKNNIFLHVFFQIKKEHNISLFWINTVITFNMAFNCFLAFWKKCLFSLLYIYTTNVNIGSRRDKTDLKAHRITGALLKITEVFFGDTNTNLCRF